MPAKGARSRSPVRRDRRAVAGVLTRLEGEQPSVTLNRLQSGLGGLAINLVGVGAERAALACAYEIDATPHPRTLVVYSGSDPVPKLGQVMWGSFKQHQRVLVDLRQVVQLRRALFFLTTSPGSGTSSCALLFAARGVDMVECPLDLPPEAATVVVATIYNVYGELVIRSEVEVFHASPRKAAEAHGFSLPYSGA